jgi:hypothetical protein
MPLNYKEYRRAGPPTGFSCLYHPAKHADESLLSPQVLMSTAIYNHLEYCNDYLLQVNKIVLCRTTERQLIQQSPVCRGPVLPG